MQQIQTVEFAVKKNESVIQRVGKISILQPKTNFKGGSIKWLPDRPKRRAN